MPQYLSTDPNAGTPVTKGYLSMDPTAGEPLPAPDFRMTVNASEGVVDRPRGLATIGELIGDSGGLSALMARNRQRVRDVGGGAVSGLMSSAFHGGDVIRRGLGMERVIETPEAQAAMAPPEGLAGNLGFLAEQIAEFAVPLTKVSKAVKAASFGKKLLAESAASAGVAGVQSGGEPIPTALGAAGGAVLPFIGATTKAARRAAAGAREGGMGGAIANAVRSVAPSDPKTMIVQALKPRASSTGFDAALDRALPELKATEAALGKPIENVDDLLKATKAAKQRIRAQYDSLGDPQRQMGSTVDLTPVGDAIEQSIPRKVRLQSPARARRIAKQAALYRKRYSLEDAEQFLKETNAEIEAFYDKFPASQRRAIAANPEIARKVAEAKALRDAIYQSLDAPGQGNAARELQRRYGSLLEVEETAFRRSNVAKRQQPESLSEQIGAVRAAGEIARGAWKVAHGNLTGAADIAAGAAGRSTAKFLKEQQTTDALIKRAFATFSETPTVIQMPARRPVRGLLPQAAHITPPPTNPSFVRGVPAQYAQREVQGLLPSGRIPLITPVPSHGSVRSVAAKRQVQRDPRTGRMRRIYTGEVEDH